MADFLLELRSEEIPARMQARARVDLGRLFREQLAGSGLRAEAIETVSTPRRLALVARGLPNETDPVHEERRGPRADAPTAAIEGFLKSTGLSREQLEEREDRKGGKVLFATIRRPGRATAALLAEIAPQLIRGFPWPKSMRWGAESASTGSLRWVRPLQGVVALLGDAIVEFEIGDVRSGAATVGHRFHHPGVITIGSAADYAEKLRACRVLVDHAEREAIIRSAAAEAAAAAGLRVIGDEGLVVENVGLTEWPVPLLGGFALEFLDLPPEVIQLTMRTNQKYFAVADDSGRLAPHFVCVANVEASDGGRSIVAGNEKVLAARLSDARFFWEQDLKVPLDEQAKKLDQIVFHEKLGTVAAKVERIAQLACWLVDRGVIGPTAGADVVELREKAERAARLAKVDLVSGMVGEFPELQGIIGGYLASAQGESPDVAAAVRDHYKPAGQGDEIPSAPVTVAVSLADKLDTIVSFFLIEEFPTGSKDPFALRRAALGAISLIVASRLRLPILELVEGHCARVMSAATGMTERSIDDRVPPTSRAVVDFFADRLKVQEREAGVRHDLIDAVFSLGGEDDLVRLLARVKALQSFIETDEGADLLVGYRRAANILRKEGWSPADRIEHSGGYGPAREEAALVAALEAAEPKGIAAVQDEEFEAAMAALATLRGPVDSFFDKVTVNDPDPGKRAARLALLSRLRDGFHLVADFSKIEG